MSIATFSQYESTQNAVVVKSRNVGIDLGRIVAFVCVVLVHTTASIHWPQWTAAPYKFGFGEALDTIGRAGVPFFFAASGYFFINRINNLGRWSAWWSVVRRILPLYGVWFVFYNTLWPSVFLKGPVATALSTLTGGTGFHLWYLPSLVVVLGIIAIAPTHLKTLFVVGVVMYAGGLLTTTYWFIALPHESSPMIRHAVRGLPCFGLPFCAFGAWWATEGKGRGSIQFLAIGAVLLAALSIFETVVLAYLHLSPPGAEDMLVTTLPLGMVGFALATCIQLSGPLVSRISVLAKLSFGLYAVHLAFVLWLIPIFGNPGIGGRLCVAAATVAGAMVVSVAADRIPRLGVLFR